MTNLKPGIDLHFSNLTAAKVEHDRDITVAREAVSLEEWARLDPDVQAAIRYIVEHHLEVVIDRIDSWLPASLTMDTAGGYVDITVRLIFGDITTEAESKRETTARQVRMAAAETLAMAKGEDLDLDDDRRSTV